MSVEVPLDTLLLTMLFSSFLRESQRMQKESPAKVRLASQHPSPADPGSTLTLPQTSLLANTLLLPQNLTSFWKSEQKLQTGCLPCPAP